jgi:hypothetical protein
VNRKPFLAKHPEFDVGDVLKGSKQAQTITVEASQAGIVQVAGIEADLH